MRLTVGDIIHLISGGTSAISGITVPPITPVKYVTPEKVGI